MAKELRVILGDQLNHKHTWFKEVSDEVVYLMMECHSETNYVRHHIQKIIGFFLAMRSFSKMLKEEGHQVVYLKLDDSENQQSIASNIKYQLKQNDFEKLGYQLPDEYRLDQVFEDLKSALSLPVEAYDTEHFVSSRQTVSQIFEGKKQFLMETFYRKMRKEHSVLMQDDGQTPINGRWNYDAENRKKLPKKIDLPKPKEYLRDVSSLLALIEQNKIETIGRVEAEAFDWPVTRAEFLDLLDHFLEVRFMNFGRYQDSMTDRDYLLFHSKLSFGLNTKLIDPLEVVQAAEAYWQAHQDEIDIAQVEGFIRQILGWREYMRGIYWAKMPEYRDLNYFEHDAALPTWFWNGETKMKCLSHSINQSLDKAYAHHIQRLMVTGNFALLIGVHPDEVDAWYLGIYMDALEWVEITNTRGMSQFADGGIVGTKPYVSSANYIHKMGDYCSNCYYDRKTKVGERACPFNSLYWDFYARHREKLQKNPRVAMMYRVWNKMDGDDQAAILKQAANYKSEVENL
ncbi:MAG: cryptochrome/photolyase family protein [Saprospiraceae bacterium]